MAFSLPKAVLCFLATYLAGQAVAETKTYNWNITWVTANPDNLLERPVIGINNQWPLPLVNITKGDRVIFNVNNQVRISAAPLNHAY